MQIIGWQNVKDKGDLFTFSGWLLLKLILRIFVLGALFLFLFINLFCSITCLMSKFFEILIVLLQRNIFCFLSDFALFLKETLHILCLSYII